MNLAYRFPIIYWDCANLIVDSGGYDKGTNYDKVAIAINKMKTGSSQTEISLIDINRSEMFFTPDEEHNQILYGMSALNGVGSDVLQTIISNRPYSSWEDVVEKTGANRTVMLSLIKAGAFDEMGDRKDVMRSYLSSIAGFKSKVTLQNFSQMIEYDVVPDEIYLQQRVFRYNKALKANCKEGDRFVLDLKPYYWDFYEKNFDVDAVEPSEGHLTITEKAWKKQYDLGMKPAKDYLRDHQDEMVEALNSRLMDELWDKYASGTYSTWEMESLGMYWHEHELAPMNKGAYDVSEFSSLEPSKVSRIAGTVIAKDDLHSSISLLTEHSGVVTVKLGRDFYAQYNRKISQVQPDGRKKMMEDSFFRKGTLLVVEGFRRGETFVKRAMVKGGTGIYKILEIKGDGAVEAVSTRMES